jgi:hypothetical protein
MSLCYLFLHDELAVASLRSLLLLGLARTFGTLSILSTLQFLLLLGELSLETAVTTERLINGALAPNTTVDPKRDDKVSDARGKSNIVSDKQNSAAFEEVTTEALLDDVFSLRTC